MNYEVKNVKVDTANEINEMDRPKKTMRRVKTHPTVGTVGTLCAALIACVNDVFALSMFAYVLWNDCINRRFAGIPYYAHNNVSFMF